MKKLILAGAMALTAMPAFAQVDSDNYKRPALEPQQQNVPSYQRGSGDQSGGPANELIPPSGMPSTTGTVIAPGSNQVLDNNPNTKLPSRPINPATPSYQQGSGQESGGPARELQPR